MSQKSNISVFEKYAHEYDLITNAVQREKYHAREVAAMIDKFQPLSVLDAGCATGLTAMLFARKGIKTVGLDRSRKMVAEARVKYKQSDLLLSFLCGHFEKLPERMHHRFDMVVCLANSISGVGSVVNLKQALRSFHNVLNPGGVLVLQMLNYTSIKEGELVPIRVTENNGIIYTRFSERRGKKLFVYVIRTNLSDSPVSMELFRHQFGNFTAEKIVTSLKKVGFVNLRKYSDLYFSNRFTARSRDLVITVQKLNS